ncbi:G8 domain-containing protein DDB_G0286311-like isoform X3 [Hermetia illucens]|uniref:G8 domain-containing protein DDB_G0286311-like isoform X3 n=1 Tax=Hermetia illucens TaxID=343691 RepID=UPI0018CBF24C|nr:G8 domain-containing protein DDB_G0286311-like isoform X3 [Hermetia illucens]
MYRVDNVGSVTFEMARSKMCSRGSNFGGFWLTTVNFIVFLMVFNSNISNGMCGLRVLRQAQATGANDPTNQNATVPELPITPDSAPGSGATNTTTDPPESPLAVNPPVNPVENPTAVQSANETAPQLNATSATVTDPATVAPTTIPTTTTTTLAPTTVAPATTETPTTTTQKPAMEKPSEESPNGKGAASNMSYNVAFILVTIALLSF